MKIYLTSILILFLLLFSVHAEEDIRFNYTCPFDANMKLVNYSLDIYSFGEYYPYLIENEQGLLSFKVEVFGDWIKYGNESWENKILASMNVYCDGEVRAGMGGPPTFYNVKKINESLITEFIWNREFSIPPREERKFCYAVNYILGLNETWMDYSSCSICACPISDVSLYIYRSDTKEIWTKEAFFSKRQIDIQESQFVSGALVAGFFTILGSLIGIFGGYYLQKWNQNRLWKKSEIEEIYIPLYRNINSILRDLERYPKDSFSTSEWDKIKSTSAYWKLKPDLKIKLEGFYTKLIPEYETEFQKVKEKIYKILYDQAGKISEKIQREYIPQYGLFESKNHTGNLTQVNAFDALIQGKTPRQVILERTSKSKGFLEVMFGNTFTNDKDIIKKYDKLINSALRIIKTKDLLQSLVDKRIHLITEAKNLEKELQLVIKNLNKI